MRAPDAFAVISIHAPLRERHAFRAGPTSAILFQSTLPYGSDMGGSSRSAAGRYFNPRSLTGATAPPSDNSPLLSISIHAPLRERRWHTRVLNNLQHFNPRSLTGATWAVAVEAQQEDISIHAPLRERLYPVAS